jgi:hypothetical protein
MAKTWRSWIFGESERIMTMITILAAALLIGSSGGQGLAREKSNLLGGIAPAAKLKDMILPIAAWHPYPKAGDAAGWLKIPEAVRAAHIRKAEKRLNCDWPLPKASVFLDFVRDGNRSRYEAVSFSRRQQLWELVIGECVEGRGRFMDDILNGVWAICEESFWGAPAHLGAQKRGEGLPDMTEPIVDLFAAETGMLLAWTDYLLGDALDAISPLIRERIRYEIRRRILTPNLERDDFWWMGLQGQMVNNWNPWICSNWLTAALLVENDPARRIQAVAKIVRCLDQFLNAYPKDGGCDEGPGYWDRAGGSLFDCLELLASASNGKIDIFSRPLVREIGRYIGRVHIAGRYYINFADAAARFEASASLIYRYGRSIRDKEMEGFGAYLAGYQGLGKDSVYGSFGGLGRILPALFSLTDLLKVEPREPLARDFWLPELQVMGARSIENSRDGLYLAAKGGHNAESHNHNDVGNFIVYADGKPVLIDIGVETYTAKTFSSSRYEIWTMQSAYHNLPTINGVMQKEGRPYRASDVRYEADAGRVVFELDIAKAYPPEAAVKSWKRSLTLERGRRILIAETYELESVRRPLALTLMSWRKPSVLADGRIRLDFPEPSPDSKPLHIVFDKNFFEAGVETISLRDEKLRASWGETLYRILLTARQTPVKGRFEIRIEN